MGFEILCNSGGVGTVAFHADVQGFQSHVEQECALRRLYGAEVTHQLCGRLGDERAFLAKAFCIRNAVVAVIGRGQPRELVGMCHPVKVAGIDDASADGSTVTVHVLGRGMGDDVSTPFKRTAVDGRCKGVVDDQRNAVCMCRVRKLFDVKHSQCRIGDCFTEDRLGVRTECRIQFFFRAVGIDECEFDTHALHRDGEQIICTAVDCRGGNDMVARRCDVENRIEGCRLTGGGQHGSRTAFHFTNLCCNRVAGRVLQAGVEIAGCFQVKQFAHFRAGCIFKRRGLNDRNLSGFTVSGGITALHTFCFDSVILFHG